jgi:hypothetical protein
MEVFANFIRIITPLIGKYKRFLVLSASVGRTTVSSNSMIREKYEINIMEHIT